MVTRTTNEITAISAKFAVHNDTKTATGYGTDRV